CAATLHPSMGSEGTKRDEVDCACECSRIDTAQSIDIVGTSNDGASGSIPRASSGEVCDLVRIQRKMEGHVPRLRLCGARFRRPPQRAQEFAPEFFAPETPSKHRASTRTPSRRAA